MKILLDECVTKHLKPFISNHEVFTVREMEWSGIKNGKLMKLCSDNGFDIFLTIDKNLMYQQNLSNYSVAVVVLNSYSSKVEELKKFISAFENNVASVEKGKAYLLDIE